MQNEKLLSSRTPNYTSFHFRRLAQLQKFAENYWGNFSFHFTSRLPSVGEKLMITINEVEKRQRDEKNFAKLAFYRFYWLLLKEKMNVISKSNHNNEHYLLLQSSLSHFLLQWFLFPLHSSLHFSCRCFKALYMIKRENELRGIPPSISLTWAWKKRGNINDIWFRILIL